MSASNPTQLANFIWSICNLLRGPYKRNEYRKVILPLTVLRRFDSLLAATRAQVRAADSALAGLPPEVRDRKLQQAAGRTFYNTSKLDFGRLLDEPDQLAPNLISYIHAYSQNVREIMERFAFEQQIARMAEKNLLYQVVKAFANVDLSLDQVDDLHMGYAFEELIRIGAEQSNEESGDHFTPREVIRLMVNLLLSPEEDLRRSHVVKTIYDPACGTGGMLSVSERYIRDLNADADPHLFGQDWNDDAYATCKADMLIKGEDADNIRLGDTFTKDAFLRDAQGRRITFDYMLANPPFGVEWKQQQRFIENEHATLGYSGRFGAGLPRINDGSLLFLQHMLSKMRPPEQGGSRIAIVFNGSPLFTGDAGSGESNIRKWILEHDWLEAIVALPDQLFYNTGISTYVWVLTNRKAPERRGKVQLIDGRGFFVKMKKSLGNKRNRLGEGAGEPGHIGDLTRLHGAFRDGETREVALDGKTAPRVVSRVFDNEDFGYRKITVERPLRLNFALTPERRARLEEEPAFRKLAVGNKKDPAARAQEEALGRERQEQLRALLEALAEEHPGGLWRDREAFRAVLKDGPITPRLTAAETKLLLAALGERDETAEVCRDAHGRPEPDPDLRDTENVPLKEDVGAYFAREVLPHVPDAWLDHSKTKVGYEIPLNRHFYVYEPPRPLEEIEAEIRTLEGEILTLLGEVTGSGEVTAIVESVR